VSTVTSVLHVVLLSQSQTYT